MVEAVLRDSFLLHSSVSFDRRPCPLIVVRTFISRIVTVNKILRVKRVLVYFTTQLVFHTLVKFVRNETYFFFFFFFS
jgi:hypothetical protein